MKNKKSAKQPPKVAKKQNIKKQQQKIPKVNVTKFKSKNANVEKPNVVPKTHKFVNRKNRPLKERMELRLKAAKFRIMNERLYISSNEGVKQIFEGKSEFEDYHEGFRQQVNAWPINPLQIIVNSIRKYINKNPCIADFGCGEAELAKTFTSCKVHSFDLYSTNEFVTACDMAKTKLPAESVDIAVFCLSLMGSSNSRYIAEANRALKIDGIMKIAEVESRFENSKNFVNDICKHGFKLVSQNVSHDVFQFFDFKKISNISKKRKNKLPEITLKPCMYKKR